MKWGGQIRKTLKRSQNRSKQEIEEKEEPSKSKLHTRTSGLHKFIIQVIDGRDRETIRILWRPLPSDTKEETIKTQYS